MPTELPSTGKYINHTGGEYKATEKRGEMCIAATGANRTELPSTGKYIAHTGGECKTGS